VANPEGDFAQIRIVWVRATAPRMLVLAVFVAVSTAWLKLTQEGAARSRFHESSWSKEHFAEQCSQ